MIRYLHVRQPLRRSGELRGVHAAAAHHVAQQPALPLLILQLHREEYVPQVSIYYSSAIVNIIDKVD